MIISGAFNIAPSEIEAVVGELEGVHEVCVIAADDAKFGETPAAVVVADRALTAAQVVEACSARLASYKVPRYLIVQQEPLPRMASGKIARRELQARYGDIAATHERIR
jgi:fatty-acyl-CoA synthase